MKLQVITLAALVTSIFAADAADAGKFNLGKVVRTAQKVQNTYNRVQQGGGKPKYVTLPYEPPQHGGHPGHGGRPGRKPVCKPKPIPHPGHGHVHKPVCKPPVNRPPVKCFTLKLINNAGAEVHYLLNEAEDYRTMPTDDVDWIKTKNPAPHTINYHNGQGVVEYELDPNGTYGFEWQGDTLQLLEIQG